MIDRDETVKRLHRLGALILVGLAVPLTRSASQVARGTVTERGTGAAIPGVLVSLVDVEGRVISTVFTDEQGGYDVSAPAAGR